jgi:regulatory protein
VTFATRRERVEPAAEVGARITGIEPDPRRPGVVRVYVEGRLTWSVAVSAVAAEELGEGMVVDDGLRARLEAAADEQAAWRTVLRHLARRAFARHDLERRLCRKGHPPAAVARAVVRAADAGLLDDARFAAEVVELKAARGRGPARLLADLAAMGVPDAIARRAVSAWSEAQEDPDVMPRNLARRRAGQLHALPQPVRRRRVINYLARRGFRGSRVRELVDEVLTSPD